MAGHQLTPSYLPPQSRATNVVLLTGDDAPEVGSSATSEGVAAGGIDLPNNAPASDEELLPARDDSGMQPSRRAVLCGALATGLVTSAASAASVPQDAWARAVAGYHAADAAVDRFEREVRAPTLDRIMRAAGPRPPHSFRVEHSPGFADEYDLPWHWNAGGVPRDIMGYEEACAAVDAHRRWQARHDAAERAEPWAPIEARETLLIDELVAARDALLATPAPDVRALAFKMNLVLPPIADCGADGEVERLLAEAERLAA